MDSSTFLDVLRQSRLLSEQQLAQIAGRLSSGEATQVIASSLVADGALTPFQVRRLTAGQTRGLVLGQYRLLEELGSGGFGQVFRALHTVMGRVVAVKVVAPHVAEDARARGLFKREVQAATQLCHPNIVMAYDANEEDGVLFLVMEYVDGPDLETVIRKQGPLAISTAHEVMRQACLGLQHAHEKGMVHRDIKPANMLLPRGPGPVVKIVDFGLARLYGSAAAASMKTLGDKGFLGTPDYVSPEQARSAATADVRSDLYSLGCTFYFALTGRKPFAGETPIEILIKHLEEEPEPLEELRPELPPGIAAIVRRLMAKDPGKRFQTPAEVVTELDFLGGRAGAASLPAAAPAVAPIGSGAIRRKAAAAPTPAGPRAPARTQALPEAALGVTPSGPVADLPAVGRARSLLDGRTEELSGAGVTMAVEVTPLTTVHPSARLRPTPVEVPPPAALDEPPLAESVEADGAEDAVPTEDAPPAATRLPVTDRRLVALWRQWRAVVEAFVERDGGCPVDEPGYRALHRELRDACRAQAAASAGLRLELLRRLESLVEPWVTLDALAGANPDALAGLLLDCREVGTGLFGADRDRFLAGWAALLAAVVLAGMGGLYLLGRATPGAPPKLSLSSLWSMIQANPVVAAAVAVPVVVLVSIYLVARPSRS